MFRGRNNKRRRNENPELELERMLKSKSLESIQKLQTILRTNSKDEPLELSDFFEFRKHLTSIDKNDVIISELVIKILNDKHVSEDTQVTNNNDEEIDFDPRELQEADKNDVSSHKSWQPERHTVITDDVSNQVSQQQSQQSQPSQVRQHNAIKKRKLNGDAPEFHPGCSGIGHLNGVSRQLSTITEEENSTSQSNIPHASQSFV